MYYKNKYKSKREKTKKMTEQEKLSNRVNAYVSIISIKQQQMKDKLLSDAANGGSKDNLEFIFDYLALMNMYDEVISLILSK